MYFSIPLHQFGADDTASRLLMLRDAKQSVQGSAGLTRSPMMCTSLLYVGSAGLTRSPMM